jgi:glycosyltransferase involved in cell wall biosynthesis
MNPAIHFEPDGYLPQKGGWIMGRQSAGIGFLRAVVAGRGDAPVRAYSPTKASGDIFRRTVAGIDPAATAEWISGQRLDLLSKVGLLYRPDQILGRMARQRLRVSPAAYALCGVTHTLATHRTLDGIAKIVTEPVMPWDALICTSHAARSVVTAVLDHETELQRWRTGAEKAPPRPLLPMIPLGVHCSDFAGLGEKRDQARKLLGVGPNDVVLLSAGRLSMNGKWHPFQTLTALQAVAADCGHPIALVLAGQAYNDKIQALFEQSTETLAPDVRTIFVDGREEDAYRNAWAAADIFISLADSIQETFGLTPLEAMAAGLPSLVSDWNGYRDTVRDGVDGFRITTWAPEPGGGAIIAHDYEIGLSWYEDYLFRCNTAVSLDMRQLVARLRELIANPELRRRMGAEAKARARTHFDWSVVYRSYQALWAEQTDMRERARKETAAWLSKAPRSGSDHMGPFDTFAAYPSHQVSRETRVALLQEISDEAYLAMRLHPVWVVASVVPELHARLRDSLKSGSKSIAELVAVTQVGDVQTIEVVARLAKMGILALDPPRAQC